MSDTLSRIRAKERGQKPYTAEQLANTLYVGTISERMDRAAGGPELRKRIAAIAKTLFIR